MKQKPIVLAVMILAGAGLTVLGACQASTERAAAGPDKVTMELRKAFLDLTPEEAGITVPATGQGIWGGAMDIALTSGSATLISTIEGTASLYLSSGGAMIGGEAHEPVRKAAQAFVESLESCSSGLKPGSPQDLPRDGKVRFYALSRSGLLLSEEVSEAELVNQGHALHPCYRAAQEVISQMRLMANEEGSPGGASQGR